jgi:glycosyltransferase involved in cell wall biosynthesis
MFQTDTGGAHNGPAGGIEEIKKKMNIYIVRTVYPQWAKHSGIHQYVNYVDGKAFSIKMSLVSDGDDDSPIHNRLLCKWIRTAVQQKGMQWYKLSDLIAEIRVFYNSHFSNIDVLHYLDGEHSAQFRPPIFKYFRRTRPKVVATYHQPPHLLDSLLIKDVLLKIDAIVVMPPEQADYFNQFLPRDRIHFIPHGIDTNYYTTAPGFEVASAT